MPLLYSGALVEGTLLDLTGVDGVSVQGSLVLSYSLVLWYSGILVQGTLPDRSRCECALHRLASSNRPSNDLVAVFYCCLLMLLLMLMLLLIHALCCSCCCAHSGSNVLHMLNSICCVPLLCAGLKWSSRQKKEKTGSIVHARPNWYWYWYCHAPPN